MPQARCPHCDGPVADEDADAPFCCPGCRAARALLHELGLEDYYALRDAPGAPAGVEPRPLPWLPPLVEAAEQSASGGIARLSLDVQGVTCAACVWLLERLFSRRQGAVKVEVNPGAGTLTMFWRSGVMDVQGLVEEAARLGYLTAPPGGRVQEGEDLTLRMAIASALALNTMILSSSFYLGLDSAADAGLFRTFTWVTFALGALSVLVGGSVFIQAAWRAARHGLVHLDLPIALGIVLAFVGSTWSAFFGSGEAVYFDTLTTFVALMLVGRWLQHRVVQKNRRALLEDRGASDLVARVERDGVMRVVSALSVREGDVVVVASGEMLPMKGVLLSSAADLSLEWIDGEPAPRSFLQGDDIPAGSRNRSSSPARVRAAERFDASRLFSLLGAGRAAEVDETSPFSFLQVVARAYVIIVLLLAGGALLFWWSAGVERALEVAVAVLVVTCPCALGLATPLAIELAESRLLRAGLFVRRHGLLERALAVRRVVFDKTGTVTLGELRVANEQDLLSLDSGASARLSTMASSSNHPKSRAIARALEPRDGAAPVLGEDERLTELPGRGLQLVAHDGVWRLGSRPFVAGEAARDDDVVFARDGHVLARLSFEETLRPEARQEVRALADDGLEVYLLSGDASERVRALAALLGVDETRALGGMSPEAKAAWIDAHAPQSTLMIGDGINDALALDAAACAGTCAIDHPTLPARADFYLVGRRVAPIHLLLQTARRLRATLYGNLVLASAYNIVTVCLAMAGLMSPLLCALAMPISSIAILTFSARRLGETREHRAARALPRLPLRAEEAVA